MALPKLTIIPAGAGSGKTYTIQTTLAQWIQDNEVEPDRIVAVTFTEAAAAELRERIRAELVQQKRHEDALKLDQAYISTIHGFGLRLLGEFAFDAGLNPSPRLLTEDEEKVLIRIALTKTDQAVDVMKNLAHFGYRYNFSSKEDAEGQFRGVVLGLMDKLRSIGRFEQDPALTEQALERISSLYGAVGKAEVLKQKLAQAVRRVLQAFPKDISYLCKTNGVAEKVRKDHNMLWKAAREKNLTSDWKLWQQLRLLQTSTPRNPLPEDYDLLVAAVIDTADGLVDHSGPRQDALEHARALLDTAQSSLGTYAEHKAQRGLLDFTDMLALTQQMLLEHPAVLKVLSQRFQCLVIDEFQDTNPLQFALLWAFRKAGVPTLVVGDLKQAIMGFQNADARLLAELQSQNSDSCHPLTGNWRTHSQLMPWVNDIGAGLFGQGYTHLESKTEFDSYLSPLEIIEFSARAKNQTRAEHTVARIKALLEEDNCRVFDRHQKITRPIRGGDIAIICPRNKRLKEYAEILRNAGIKSRINKDGWFTSRVVQLLYHVLCFVADPTDNHAALYLAVTELGEESLESALKTLLQGNNPDNTVIKLLTPVREGGDDRSISTILFEVTDALDLFGIVAVQTDAAQARANLLRFQAEAKEFEDANREALASGGYYGSELKTFLAWLRDKVERDDEQPEPRVQDEDAVQLVTWHRSKGREWPVVVVSATDNEILCKLPSLDVNYEDFSDLGSILDKARLDISPEYVAPEKNEPLLETLWQEAEDSARRLLYVALTRAREKIILECPAYLDNGKERKSVTYWELLAHDTGMTLNGNKLRMNGNEYDCRVVKVGKERSEMFEAESLAVAAPLSSIGRRAIEPKPLPINLTPETVRPSLHEIETVSKNLDLTTLTYADPFALEFDLASNVQGTLLHRCFEVLDGSCQIETLNQATDFDFTPDQFIELKGQVEKFDAWIQEYFQPKNVQKEVSVLALDDNGSVINGFIDLLVETEDGFWIIDHKSDRTDDYIARFTEHLPQLLTYHDAVNKTQINKPVIGVGINWIYPGNVALLLL
ncbi:MAG: UvrD-helicase domain-containing protein [Desulfuromusa sp.]